MTVTISISNNVNPPKVLPMTVDSAAQKIIIISLVIRPLFSAALVKGEK